jgi:hypothetical protein
MHEVCPERGWFRMVKIKCKSVFLGEGSFPSGFAIEASMIFSGRNCLPVHVIGMEHDLCCLHDDVIHVSVSHGQDPGVLKLDTVTQVCAVFSHILFIRMIQPDVLQMFLDPGLNRTPGLTNVDLTTFTGASCFQTKVILHGPKETCDLPRQKAYSFDVMFCYHPADAVEDRSRKG